MATLDRLIERRLTGECPHCGVFGPLLGLYIRVNDYREALAFRCAKTDVMGKWVWDSEACWRRWDEKQKEVPRV